MSPRKQAEKRVKRTVHIPQMLNDWLNEESGRSGISGNDVVILALTLLRQQGGLLAPPPPTAPTPEPDVQPDLTPPPAEDEEGFASFD